MTAAASVRCPVRASVCYTPAPMPDLLAALDAFLQEHRRCGDLDGGGRTTPFLPAETRGVTRICDTGPRRLIRTAQAEAGDPKVGFLREVRSNSQPGLTAWYVVPLAWDVPGQASPTHHCPRLKMK